MKKTTGVCAAILAIVVAHGTQAGDWKFSLGANYRGFGEADFEAFGFTNPAANTGNGFVTGDTATALRVDVGNDALQVAIGDGDADLHKVSFSGASDNSMDSSTGIILGGRTTLDSGISLDVSLAFAQLDSGASLDAAATTENYATPGGAWTISGDGSSFWVGAGWVGPGAGAQVDVTGQVDYDINIDVLTLGCGFGAGLDIADSLKLSVAVGPTITLADFDVTRTERVWFTDAGRTPVYTNQQEDDGTDVIFGAYAGVTVGYDVTERIGIELGARYDYMVSEVDSDFADFDLSGLSGELTVIFSF